MNIVRVKFDRALVIRRPRRMEREFEPGSAKTIYQRPGYTSLPIVLDPGVEGLADVNASTGPLTPKDGGRTVGFLVVGRDDRAYRVPARTKEGALRRLLHDPVHP